MRYIDLTGQKFTRLSVVAFGGKDKYHNAKWLCRCDCGTEKLVVAAALKSGATQSCGCLNKENATRLKTKHGLSKHPAYKCWEGMMSRCYNKDDKDYVDYGGRGIRVCAQWHDVAKFVKDMGERGAGMTLERENVNSHYQPSNCRWATALEQGANKRNNNTGLVNGELLHLAGAARKYGVAENTIRNRLARGFSFHDAVTMQPERNRKKKPTVKRILRRAPGVGLIS